jgi:hypothetical protein
LNLWIGTAVVAGLMSGFYLGTLIVNDDFEQAVRNTHENYLGFQEKCHAIDPVEHPRLYDGCIIQNFVYLRDSLDEVIEHFD